MNIDEFLLRLEQSGQKTLAWLQTPQSYGQLGFIFGALIAAWVVTRIVRPRLKVVKPVQAPGGLGDMTTTLNNLIALTFPVMRVVMLAIAVEISRAVLDHSAVVRIAQAIAVIMLVRAFVTQFISARMIIFLINYVLVPAALLHVFGRLDEVTNWLSGFSLSIGNIGFSAYAILRTAVFGALLFWLGRLSNDTGKRVIRRQETMDLRTRELMTKLFEITLFVVVFLVLLQVMGINLTTLAVFGGAIGVGLGFGLQQIAANFISGIIILLDKSLTIGDYIELEDGRGGVIRELGLRCATVETFDGKDIVVPNDTFITTSFTNWTHFDNKQRYDLTFSVAYDTDLPEMISLIREVVASHPQVLSGPEVPEAERPDAEIDNFGDNGIDILVEFWMIGVDDGKNRVGADIKMMIWKALKENNITIPFPQREVRIL